MECDDQLKQSELNLSIIIPAFNEEQYLAATIDGIRRAIAATTRLPSDKSNPDVEIIVVDNNSSDLTADVATAMGAKVVRESVQGISRARNSGAKSAKGETFVFIDADVIVPDSLFVSILDAMDDPNWVGGGVEVEYRPRRPIVRAYLGMWRILSRLTDMVQGATQFCRREAFEAVGGYDETVWIGEDVDFYWALKRHAKRTDGHVRVIREARVLPSTRRFDKWPLWRILVFTNPLFIAAFRRWKRVWGGWYSDAVR